MLMKKNIIITNILLFILLFIICGCSYNYNTKQYISNYSQILADFKITVKGILSESFETDFNNGKFVFPNENLKYEWGNMLIDAKDGLDNPTEASFGYVLKDINNDNISELFFVREDYTILAIFTLVDSKPKLLGAFWSRYSCVMLDNNDLYILSSNGADNFEYTIYRLSANNELKIVKQFGMNNSYYERINDEIVSVSKIQFDKILGDYPYVSGTHWQDNEFYNL